MADCYFVVVLNLNYFRGSILWVLLICYPLQINASYAINLVADSDDGTSEVLDRKIDRLRVNKNALKVLWWNIRYGKLAKEAEEKNLDAINPLEHNIRALMNSDLKPDILIFSEYSLSSFSESTTDYLLHNYSTVAYENNNALDNTGIAVFTNLQIQGHTRRELDWAPLLRTRNEKIKYRDAWIKEFKEALFWDRSYWRLSFEYKNKFYHIMPVHLLQPWDAIQKKHNFIFGFIRAGVESLFGDFNPLVQQVRRLLSAYTIDAAGILRTNPSFDRIHPGFYPDDRAMIIGDFNIPKSYFGFESLSYKYITSVLKDTFDNFEDENDYTHPTPSAPEHWSYPNLKIDHAFVNDQVDVKAAEVLPLKGSDHFPIYVSIE